jgi:ribonuclease-3
MDVEKLEGALAVTFKNHDLLKQAFTHSSYVNEHQRGEFEDNERLEFLGDAVLELAVSDHLYNNHLQMAEGQLTKLRANIVCEESLYRFSKILRFDQFILLGKGEERTGGRQRQALLADVFEAFLGALYLDQGFADCQAFLDEYIFPHLSADAFSYVMDYKTNLQEIVQQDKKHTLHYRIVEEKGPSHEREFIAEVIVNENFRAKGSGHSKKEAEQAAARNMIKQLPQKQ